MSTKHSPMPESLASRFSVLIVGARRDEDSAVGRSVAEIVAALEALDRPVVVTHSLDAAAGRVGAASAEAGAGTAGAAVGGAIGGAEGAGERMREAVGSGPKEWRPHYPANRTARGRPGPAPRSRRRTPSGRRARHTT